MAKTRLAKWSRDRLVDFAIEVVTCPDEDAEVEKQYNAVIGVLIPYLQRTFPPREMRVLKKYGVAVMTRQVDFHSYDKKVNEFNLSKDDQMLLPIGRQYYHQKAVVTLDEVDDLPAHYERWNLAFEKQKEAKKDKLNKYKALILTARFFEDVVEVWPEAESLRKAICKTVNLPSLSQDVKRFIHRDSLNRMEQKPAVGAKIDA